VKAAGLGLELRSVQELPASSHMRGVARARRASSQAPQATAGRGLAQPAARAAERPQIVRGLPRRRIQPRACNLAAVRALCEGSGEPIGGAHLGAWDAFSERDGVSSW
jgi:hypothetical protein